MGTVEDRSPWAVFELLPLEATGGCRPPAPVGDAMTAAVGPGELCTPDTLQKVSRTHRTHVTQPGRVHTIPAHILQLLLPLLPAARRSGQLLAPHNAVGTAQEHSSAPELLLPGLGAHAAWLLGDRQLYVMTSYNYSAVLAPGLRLFYAFWSFVTSAI